jgi:hypothetical protein
MRILGAVVQVAIVQVPARPMPDIGHDCPVSDAVAAQAVGDEASWFVLQTMQQVFEETLGSGAIPSALNQNVQNHAVLIHRAPQIVQHSPDADEHLIEVPGVTRLRSSSA